MTFYDNRNMKSHNCIYNYIDTERNDGKTWSFKISGTISFLKHRHKTIWNRTFVSEKKATKKKFFDKKIIAKINEELHKYSSKKWKDFKLKIDDFKLDGDYLIYKPYKDWCFCFTATSQQAQVKSVDDPDTRQIVYDEYSTTPERFARYRGNIVQDFNDLFFSNKRTHILRCYFLGNKEMIANPFKNFFNIKPLDEKFEGIKHYKEHTILVEQRNTPPEETISTDFDKRVMKMFSGTAYGEYLYHGATKGIDKTKIARRPQNASVYCCFDFGKPVTVYQSDDKMFFCNGVDKKRVIVTQKPTSKYKRVFVLTNDEIRRFMGLKNVFKMNNVFYADELAYEQAQLILKALKYI